MYTLVFSVLVAVFFTVLPMVFGVSAKWTVLPGLVLGVVAFLVISRRIARRVESVIQAADRELATAQQAAQQPGPRTKAVIAQKIDASVEILKRGFLFAKWQFGVTTMLNARIGMLLFSRAAPALAIPGANLSDSIPYLERARVKGQRAKLLSALWPAWAMLGVAYWKRKDLDQARKIFEESVGSVKKEGLLWSMYAWILSEEKLLDDAIGVLARAHAALPDDERIAENLNALQNKKKMKMRAYGEQWYQFGLEAPKMAGMQPRMMHPRAKSGSARRR